MKNQYLLPSLIIGISLIVAAVLVTNNSQELLTLKSRCHEQASKYVNSKTQNSASRLFLVLSSNYNKKLNTCLVYLTMLQLPTSSDAKGNTSYYVEDVATNEILGSMISESATKQELESWQNKLKSWDLIN